MIVKIMTSSSYVCFYVFDKHEDNIKILNDLVFDEFCAIGICTDILFNVDIEGTRYYSGKVVPTTQFCAVMTFCLHIFRSDNFSLQHKGFNCSALYFREGCGIPTRKGSNEHL
jgi:hypothetical protein